MESRIGWVPSASGLASRQINIEYAETAITYLDQCFHDAVDFLETSYFRRWAEAEAKRNQFGGPESRTFFQHPGISRITRFVGKDQPYVDRYLYKLAARAEIWAEDGKLDRAAAITAVVLILADAAPYSIVLAMSRDAKVIACAWIELFCQRKGVPKSED